MAGGGPEQAADIAVGLLLVLLGVLVWRRHGRTGVLVTLTSAAWLLGDVVAAATFLHRGPLVHLVLGYPSGRLRTAPARTVVLVAYAVSVAYPFGRSDAVSVALASAVVAVAAVGFGRAHGPLRRARGAALLAAVAAAACLCIGPAARLAGVDSRIGVLAGYDALVLAAVGLLVADLLRGRWAEDTLTGLLLDLGDADDTAGLRDRLARAVGDPSLVVGYWLPEERRYVDESGRPILSLPRPGAGRDDRVTTPVDADGGPLAVLVHDRLVLADPDLLTDVAAAARFAVANARLQAEVRARVSGVESSRRRLITAADEERRHLEDRLRHCAERRLATVADLLAHAGPPLSDLAADVDRASATLRDLALGIHPRALSGGDLTGALRVLAARSPVPTIVDAADVSVSPLLATAAYFVAAESLTNVAKYAGATSATVRLTVEDGRLDLVVEDDGVGGADPAAGTGLRGLVDRADALGGGLSVASPAGRGTRVTLRLPVGDRATPGAVSPDGSPAAEVASARDVEPVVAVR